MIIEDRVFGKEIIEEQVLIDLINSEPVQRLKNIMTSGPAQYVRDSLFSRYEHSVGVMILLRKLGAPIEEQIAGLLHDTPHTAFSHCIDFAYKNKKFGSPTDSFHEKQYEKIILQSEIPEILKKHDFEVSRLFNEENFPLLEQPIPELCADRIDYSLRESLESDKDKKLVQKIAESLTTFDNKIIMNDEVAAKEFAELFLKLDTEIWASITDLASHQILADAIRIALESNILSEEDLFGDDNSLIKLLKESGNEEILAKLSVLKKSTNFADNKNKYDFYSKTKPRYIIPRFLENGSLVKITERYPKIQEEIDEHVKEVKSGRFIQVLS